MSPEPPRLDSAERKRMWGASPAGNGPSRQSSFRPPYQPEAPPSRYESGYSAYASYSPKAPADYLMAWESEPRHGRSDSARSGELFGMQGLALTTQLADLIGGPATSLSLLTTPTPTARARVKGNSRRARTRARVMPLPTRRPSPRPPRSRRLRRRGRAVRTAAQMVLPRPLEA